MTKFLMGFMELGYRHAFTHLINFLLLPQQCVQPLLFKAFQHRSPLLLLLRVTKMITLFCWKLTFARELDAHIQPKCSTKKHYTRHSEEFYTMQSEVDTKKYLFFVSHLYVKPRCFQHWRSRINCPKQALWSDTFLWWKSLCYAEKNRPGLQHSDSWHFPHIGEKAGIVEISKGPSSLQTKVAFSSKRVREGMTLSRVADNILFP